MQVEELLFSIVISHCHPKFYLPFKHRKEEGEIQSPKQFSRICKLEFGFLCEPATTLATVNPKLKEGPVASAEQIDLAQGQVR